MVSVGHLKISFEVRRLKCTCWDARSALSPRTMRSRSGTRAWSALLISRPFLSGSVGTNALRHAPSAIYLLHSNYRQRSMHSPVGSPSSRRIVAATMDQTRGSSDT